MMNRTDGSDLKKITRIGKQDLLIVDNFGLLPLDACSRATLMEIIQDRHVKRSTMIASRLPVQQCHDIIGEPIIADAILDHLAHDAHCMELKGKSLRKRKR
jgi:DNA replication protein DnaC